MQNRAWTIYMYINKINQKKYIGQTINSLTLRAGKNGENYKKCNYFYSALKKYGWSNFEVQVLEDYILTREEANRKECEYIQLYNTTNPLYGYNITSGGNDNSYRGKKIYQIDIGTGKVIREFSSEREAALSLNTGNAISDIKHISDVCRGGRKSARGFYWCFAEDYIQPFISPFNRKNTKYLICQISLDKKLLHIYTSAHSAAKTIGKELGGQGITKACNGTYTSKAYGYYWCYYCDWSETWTPTTNRRWRPVAQIDPTTKQIIKVFNSVIEAKKYLDMCSNSGGISTACKTGKLYKNYYWKYFDKRGELHE